MTRTSDTRDLALTVEELELLVNSLNELAKFAPLTTREYDLREELRAELRALR